MKTILITGINGFGGSNFTRNYKDSHTLYGLDIYQSPKEGVERIFSWNEIGKMPPVNAIVHLAGKAHDTKNQSEVQTYFDINTGLTQRVFDCFQAWVGFEICHESVGAANRKN